MRNVHRVALIALALASACAAQPPAPAEPPRAAPPAASEPNVEGGRQLASRHCAVCHAVSADDDSRHEEAPPMRQLAERYPGALLAEGFLQRMDVGHPAMPDFRFEPSEIDALLDYLLSIQERRGV
ncbi:MAG: cytochrome c [Caulobacterales bacterium]|nr:cytochrome c [Caulobacterales bacterium]